MKKGFGKSFQKFFIKLINYLINVKRPAVSPKLRGNDGPREPVEGIEPSTLTLN